MCGPWAPHGALTLDLKVRLRSMGVGRSRGVNGTERRRGVGRAGAWRGRGARGRAGSTRKNPPRAALARGAVGS